jgi:hypothetical protein
VKKGKIKAKFSKKIYQNISTKFWNVEISQNRPKQILFSSRSKKAKKMAKSFYFMQTASKKGQIATLYKVNT